ncbi:MAG: glycosyltransferase family 2 protein [Deltaproteobacteria bacterium]|nr:glycosyltransferase family 2 protein [Deltaproteobacteria bacterium]MBI3294647.1 glycosyltransferase family 2 protein [Deltaproteobacteria bacterium]
MKSVSVVIPVYRSAPSLEELTQRISKVLAETPYEIIFVNDGSPDESWSVIERLARQSGSVRGFSMLRNFGQHNALLAGIRAARYDTIVTMDDDLQHPPESIPRLLAELGQFDVVYGYPERERHSLFRALASRATKMALQEALGAGTARQVSAFRVFPTRLREAFRDYHSPNICIDVCLTWGTSRFTAISVPHHPRKFGESNYTLGQLIRHAANMMTGFTVLPLQIASWVGFIFTAFGFCILAYVLTRWCLYGSIVPGFAFTACEIAIFSGIQLFSLGIMGEYLARMHMRSLDKPTYVIAEETPQSRETTIYTGTIHEARR